MNEVVLVSMPFGPVMSPSIALGLLTGVLKERGLRSKALYFTISFAEMIGEEVYFGISDGVRPGLLKLGGEWIFNGALFDVSEAAAEEYVRTVLAPPPHPTADVETMIADVLRARAAVDAFLDRCVEIVLAENPRIVGFTSIFQQHVASLALAKKLKQLRPDLFVIIGGANCEGLMGAETVRQFDFIDATLSGEGELVFPEIVGRVLDGRSVDGLPGVRTQSRIAADFASGHFSNSMVVTNLDDLPYPDYTDYFAQFAASRFEDEWQPSIFYETSRGCWWGERMHCTFCGLNGNTMKYRSKAGPRAIEELVTLTSAHPGCDVEVTDNILDLEYFDTFLPDLAERKLGVSLFYETKANLKRDQVRLLRDAGVLVIQPGIESLSDSVLKLMKKGVSALQNIQLLKWAKEMGIQARWNILCGFPGEDAGEYRRMEELVPMLTHLSPPTVCTVIRLDRFSPNFFDAEHLGFKDVNPLPAYEQVYLVPSDAVRNLAYYFTFGYQQPQNTDEYVRPLAQRVREWQASHEQSALFSIDCADGVIVWDLRAMALRPVHILSGIDAHLYRACGVSTDPRQIASTLASAGIATLSTSEIVLRLDPFVDAGLLLKDGNRYLALAIEVGEYQPSPAIDQRFRQLLASLGSQTERGLVIASDSSSPATEPFNKDLPTLLERENLLAFAKFTIMGNQILITDEDEPACAYSAAGGPSEVLPGSPRTTA